MKIAIIVNGRPHEGGVTTYINTIAGALRSMGHLVDVVTLFGIADYRNVRKEFTKKTDQLLKGRGLLVITAYIFSKGIILWHLLFSHLGKRYDILYAIDVSVANVALFVRRFARARVFLRVGSSVTKDLVVQGKLSDSSPLMAFFNREERRAYSRADAILPNSTWSYHYVSSVCPDAEILQPIINPVDQHVFYIDRDIGEARRRDMGIKKENIVIFFPSRLDAGKGPYVALKAFQELLSQSDRYRLIYAGRGTEVEKMKQLAQELGLDSFMHLLGGVPQADMPALYNMADVVVVPSVTHRGCEEPLANCVMEAMACGVPVIASVIGGMKDFIVSGKNGILFPEGDFRALANEIKGLVSGKEDYKKMLVKGGLETIQKNCAPREVALKLVSIFSSGM